MKATHDQINQLAYYFVNQLCPPEQASEHKFKKAYFDIQAYIHLGWTYEQISNTLLLHYQNKREDFENTYFIGSILDQHIQEKNLLNPDEEHYHKELIVETAPVRIKRLANGSIERKKSPFKGRQTLPRYGASQLLWYFYKTSHIEKGVNEHIFKRDMGKLNYLLQFYSAEELLFAIDEAKREKKFLNQPLIKDFFLVEGYIEKGKEALQKKRNTEKVIRRELKK